MPSKHARRATSPPTPRHRTPSPSHADLEPACHDPAPARCQPRHLLDAAPCSPVSSVVAKAPIFFPLSLSSSLTEIGPRAVICVPMKARPPLLHPLPQLHGDDGPARSGKSQPQQQPRHSRTQLSSAPSRFARRPRRPHRVVPSPSPCCDHATSRTTRSRPTPRPRRRHPEPQPRVTGATFVHQARTATPRRRGHDRKRHYLDAICRTEPFLHQAACLHPQMMVSLPKPSFCLPLHRSGVCA